MASSKKSAPRHTVAIIPAAGIPSNSISGHQNLPDTMLPINGKPVIGYILDDLIERSISSVVIALNQSDTVTAQYLSTTYMNRLSIKVCRVSKRSRTIIDTIKAAATHLPSDSTGIFICLGDTIYKGTLSFERSFLVSDTRVENPSKWCMAEKNHDGLLSFIDKPRDYSGSGSALCGVYFFSKPKLFLSSLAMLSIGTSELSSLLAEYQKNDRLYLVPAKRWYDCGNIENYHQARIDFLKVRFFNGISYDHLRGVITKHSQDSEKMANEVRWYQSLPTDLQIFAPRLINYSDQPGAASYQLEFYGYPSLADLFTFGNEDVHFWKMVIQKILDIHDLFGVNTSTLPYRTYTDMYVKKTISRLDTLRSQKYWGELMEQPTITINGISYENIQRFLDHSEELVKQYLYRDGADTSVMHGDLCLSNILCDPSNLLFKFIDPRGSFGKPGIYGDRKYDLAKLRHSFHGLYDFIIADLFVLDEGKDGFTFKTLHRINHEDIATLFDTQIKARGFSLAAISLIEAVLFLSMIPLHADTPKRQKAMYLTGVRTLNEFYSLCAS